MRQYAISYCSTVFSLITFLLLQFAPSPAQERAALDPSIFEFFQARNIGPANMGGRIVDLAVVDKNPSTYYLAAATGGVWKTSDAGVSWKPLTDQITCSIGAIAVSQANPDVVWIGAGEANPRNSVTWGDGVYKSTDAGKSWTSMGLKDTHHIGRIVIHPTNPEIVYVAALGHIWGANAERGVFKTIDGGKTWQHALALDADTGCIDLAMDPSEPDTLYTTAYAVRRDAYSGGDPLKQYGPKAGLYKTTDAGKTWTKLTKGLPDSQFGRCGIAIYAKDPKVVYAVVQSEKTGVGTKGNPANKGLNVTDGGIFRSDDRGESWTIVNSLVPRPFYYGQIRIDPVDDQRVYVLGTAFFLSSDGGKSFQTSGGATKQGGTAIHADQHALWINPADNKHLILGNDGGLYVSKTRAASWSADRGLPLAQFYAIAVDMRKPYRVYGGLQDNGSWGGPSATLSEEGITLADWKRINSADGFHCQCDPTDVNIVYAESQYGKPVRVDLSNPKAKSKGIQPKSGDKSDPYRFNWSSPMLLSPHNPKTLFYGGNYLFRSEDRGNTWKKISPDLTAGKAGVAYKSTGHTLTTIAESPRKAGLIYVGTDDGRVQLTKDNGETWTDVGAKIPGVPKARWITRVECSAHDDATAYVTIGRHRNDDHKPYVYKTTDHGSTWTSISNNLPTNAPVHVLRESSKNQNLLFVGTEQAVFVTFDGGKVWSRFKAGLPLTPIHDLVIHPRERDLVIGTHGRGIYIVDIGPLEECTPKTMANTAHLFRVRSALTYAPSKVDVKSKAYVAQNPTFGAAIHYYLQNPAKDVNLAILNAAGEEICKNIATKNVSGLHRAQWDLRADGKTELAAPGEYTVRLTVNGQRFIQTLRVESPD